MKKFIMTAIIAMLLNLTLVAQDQKGRPGGLFGSYSLSETNGLFRNARELNEIEGEIVNEDFGESTPLGNGIICFVTASVGYALLKRKEDKK